MKYRILLLSSLIALLSISSVVLAAGHPAGASPNLTRLAPAPLQQDVAPPNTTLEVGSPQHAELDLLWVGPGTPHTLTADDNVDPADALQTNFRFYSVTETEAPDFGPYEDPFNLRGADGPHRIEFFSSDTAGNVEQIKLRVEHLDATPPLATWTVGTPVHHDDFDQPWITNETLNTLEAEDGVAGDGSSGSGVSEIRYRLVGPPAAPAAEFSVYGAPFTIDGPDGEYSIEFFAEDNVENRGQVQVVQAYLDTTPPSVDIDGPYAGEEGVAFAFDASSTTDAGSGLAEIAWDLDGDGAFDDAAGPTATRTFADNGSYFIGIEATDNLGNSDILPSTVEVSNADPVVSITSVSSTQPYPGELITLEGSFTDTGWLDTHTAVVDWGDGETSTATVTETNEAPEAAGTFTAQHTYSAMGPFNISVTVTDEDGGSGSASSQVEVGLSPQMPGTLQATDELTFYRLTATTPGTWGSAQWQWTYGHGNPDYWWIGQGQGWLFLFLKTVNDAPAYDAQRPTEPWLNYLTVAVPEEDFQQWFWCGIFLYDEHGRSIGHGCHPEYSPPPDGAGLLHPWVAEHIQESESHIVSIVQASLQ